MTLSRTLQTVSRVLLRATGDRALVTRVLSAAGRRGVKVVSVPRSDGTLIRATWIAR